jgi:hypothetical protein
VKDDRLAALIATTIAAIALIVSSFQAYISYRSLQQYRETFLFSKRAEVCVDFLRDIRDETDQLNQLGNISDRRGDNNDRYSSLMNQVLGHQQELSGHMSFTLLGTDELADDADQLEKALGNAVNIAAAHDATKAQIEDAIAHTIGPRARLQNACTALAHGAG